MSTLLQRILFFSVQRALRQIKFNSRCCLIINALTDE